jgi:hypothetical protein
MTLRLVNFWQNKDKPYLSYRLAMEVVVGSKVMCKTNGEWIEGVYSLRPWPEEDYGPQAGLLYENQFGEQKWIPILEGDQVRLIK